MLLISLTISAQTCPIRKEIFSFEAEATKKNDAAKARLGSGLGTVIGAIAGGGKCAAIGAAVGAEAGSATVLATAERNYNLMSNISKVLR